MISSPPVPTARVCVAATEPVTVSKLPDPIVTAPAPANVAIDAASLVRTSAPLLVTTPGIGEPAGANAQTAAGRDGELGSGGERVVTAHIQEAPDCTDTCAKFTYFEPRPAMVP